MTTDLKTLYEAATEVAWAGGRRTLAWFNNAAPIEIKGDGSPVTVADRDAETVMREMIRARFPDHSIVGEEFGEHVGTAPVRWILDPIDGTKTFIRGVPFYGTLIGIEVEGVSQVGVIYIPALNEMVAAATGLGAWHNGRRCHVSSRTLAESLVVSTDETAVRARSAGFTDLAAATEMQRTWADCYGYVMVATGRAEVAIDPVMAIWDTAPLLPIIEEAGGRFTSWAGEATIHGGDSVASNGIVHDQALTLLNGR